MPNRLKVLLLHLLGREESEPEFDDYEHGEEKEPVGLPPIDEIAPAPVIPRPTRLPHQTHAPKASHSSDLSLSHLRPLPIVLKAFRRHSSDSTATTDSSATAVSCSGGDGRISGSIKKGDLHLKLQLPLSTGVKQANAFSPTCSSRGRGRGRPSYPPSSLARRSTSTGRSTTYLSAQQHLSPRSPSPSLSPSSSQFPTPLSPLPSHLSAPYPLSPLSPLSHQAGSGRPRSRLSRASGGSRPARPASRTSLFTVLDTWPSPPPSPPPSHHYRPSALPTQTQATSTSISEEAELHHLQPWGKRRLRPRPALEDVFGPLILPSYPSRSRALSLPSHSLAQRGKRSYRLAPPRFFDEVCPVLPELDLGGLSWAELQLEEEMELYGEDEESPTNTLVAGKKLAPSRAGAGGKEGVVAFPSCSPEGLERLKQGQGVPGGRKRERLFSLPLI